MNWVREVWDYKNGELFWRKQPKPWFVLDLKKPVGCKNKQKKYFVVGYKGKTYNRARLVWFWHHGEWPKVCCHINGIRTDDRIENLKNRIRNINKSTGIDFIVKTKRKDRKQGFTYRYILKNKVIKVNNDLKKLVIFRNKDLSERLNK